MNKNRRKGPGRHGEENPITQEEEKARSQLVSTNAMTEPSLQADPQVDADSHSPAPHSGIRGGESADTHATIATDKAGAVEAAATTAATPTALRPRYHNLCESLVGNGPTRELLSPIDGSTLGIIPTHTLEDLTAISATARRAQRAWARTCFSGRH